MRKNICGLSAVSNEWLRTLHGAVFAVDQPVPLLLRDFLYPLEHGVRREQRRVVIKTVLFQDVEVRFPRAGCYRQQGMASAVKIDQPVPLAVHQTAVQRAIRHDPSPVQVNRVHPVRGQLVGSQ